MKGTFRIVNISGIPLRIHWTFLLIIAWVIFAGVNGKGQLEFAHLSNLSLSVLTLFVCVILHELGHALVARRYGIKTQNIVLLPIGGVAMLERLPEDPIQELKVALAGPAVNFLIALIFAPFLLLIKPEILQDMWLFLFQISEGAYPPYRVSFFNWFIFFLVSLNIVVGVFNLIPAMPMDGGRVLRALLAIKLPRHKATKIAAILGASISGLIAIYGVFQFNWILVLIGLYVFTSAFGEFKTLKNELFLAKNKVSQLMDSNFAFINENTPLIEAVTEFQNSEVNFLIVRGQEQNIVGILTEENVLKAVSLSSEHNKPLGTFFPDPIIFTELNSTLQEALHSMYTHEKLALTVKYENEIMGVIDRDTIHHFLK